MAFQVHAPAAAGAKPWAAAEWVATEQLSAAASSAKEGAQLWAGMVRAAQPPRRHDTSEDDVPAAKGKGPHACVLSRAVSCLPFELSSLRLDPRSSQSSLWGECGW